jgi:DNA-binding transcriptional ArsR family regulator
MNKDAIHKALANPIRRDILQWLKTPDTCFGASAHPSGEGVCAGQIDQRCGLSQPAVSAHLAVLQRAGLIRSKRTGQWVFFVRDEEVITAFLRDINQDL